MGCSGARGYKGVLYCTEVRGLVFFFLLASLFSFLFFILPPLEGGFMALESDKGTIKYLSLATFLFIPSLPFFTHPVTVTVDDSGTRVPGPVPLSLLSASAPGLSYG